MNGSYFGPYLVKFQWFSPFSNSGHIVAPPLLLPLCTTLYWNISLAYMSYASIRISFSLLKWLLCCICESVWSYNVFLEKSRPPLKTPVLRGCVQDLGFLPKKFLFLVKNWSRKVKRGKHLFLVVPCSISARSTETRQL